MCKKDGYCLVAKVEVQDLWRIKDEYVPIQMIKGDLFLYENRYCLKTGNQTQSPNIVDVEGLINIDNITSGYENWEQFLGDLTHDMKVVGIAILTETGVPVDSVIWNSTEVKTLTDLLISEGKESERVVTYTHQEKIKGRELLNRLVKLITGDIERAKASFSKSAIVDNILACEELRKIWASGKFSDEKEKTSIGMGLFSAVANTEVSYEDIHNAYYRLAGDSRLNSFQLIKAYGDREYAYDFENNVFVRADRMLPSTIKTCQFIDEFTSGRGKITGTLDSCAVQDDEFVPTDETVSYFLRGPKGKTFSILSNSCIPFNINCILQSLDSYGCINFDKKIKNENQKETFVRILEDFTSKAPQLEMGDAHIRTPRDDGLFSHKSQVDLSDNFFYLSLRDKIEFLIKYYDDLRIELASQGPKMILGNSTFFGKPHKPGERVDIDK